MAIFRRLVNSATAAFASSAASAFAFTVLTAAADFLLPPPPPPPLLPAGGGAEATSAASLPASFWWSTKSVRAVRIEAKSGRPRGFPSQHLDMSSAIGASTRSGTFWEQQGYRIVGCARTAYGKRFDVRHR